MAQQNLNLGGAPNSGLGDPLQVAMTKVQANFTDLYASTYSLASLSPNVQDQITFNNACTTFGVTFNGTTDDSIALQNALNSLAPDGKLRKIQFPPNKTILLNSVMGPTGTVNGSNPGTAPGWDQTGVLNQKWYYINVTQTGYFTLGVMLYIPGNIGIDFNGCTFYQGSNGLKTLCDCMIAFTPNPNVDQQATAGQSYGLNVTGGYERGKFTNLVTSNSSFVGSIAGNQLTVQLGSVVVGNQIIGAGIPAGVKVNSGTGPYTLTTTSGLGSVNVTVASETMISGTPSITNNAKGLLVIDGLGSGVTANGGARSYAFRDCFVFEPGTNGLVLNDQAYLLSFWNCEFWNAPNGNATTQGGGLVVINGQNTGAANNENTSFYGCKFYGGGVGFICYGSEANFFGCSFDYLQQAISVNEYTGLGPNVGYNHKIHCSGCHFETFSANTHYRSPQYYIDLTNAQSLTFSDIGSFYYTQGQLGTGGNTLTAMVNPGSGGATAPFGVTLYTPGYLLQGLAQSLNTAGGTNYLVTAVCTAGVMTISNASATSAIAVGGLLQENDAANVIPPGTTIASLGTGTGGNGTYNLSSAITFTSRNIYVWNVIPLVNTGATSRYNYYP